MSHQVTYAPAQATAPAKSPERTMLVRLLIFLLILAALGALAIFFMRFPDRRPLALVLAVLGALLHELVQSGGVVHFPTALDDEVYLGTFGGVAVGLLTGLAAIATVSSAPGVVLTDAGAVTTGLTGFVLKGGAESLVAHHSVRAMVKESLLRP